MQIVQKKASEKYIALRVALLRRGYSLRSFALRHGYPIPTVYDAARGTRAGVKSMKIAKHLKEVAYAE